MAETQDGRPAPSSGAPAKPSPDPVPDPLTERGTTRRELVVRGAGALGALSVLGAASALGETAVAASRTAARVRKGGTLVLGADAVGVDFVPPHVFAGRGLSIAKFAIFESLYDYPNGDLSKALQPVLASGPPKVSANGLQYTVQLKKGIKFHDGTRFDAEAVEFNFMRYLDKNHPYYDPNATYLRAPLLTGVASVKAIGDYTVRFTMSQTVGNFTGAIANTAWGGIMSPTAIKKAGVANAGLSPIGTGPFRFVSARQGDAITLARNDAYWNGAASLDRLIIREIPDPRTLTASLLSGEVQLSTFVARGDVALFRKNKNFNVSAVPSIVTGYMGLNAGGSGGFKNLLDVRKRQAVCHAVNKQKIINLALSGLGVRGAGMNPPASWGYQKRFYDFNKYNPTTAKSLLKAAGGSPDLLILAQSSGYWPQMAEIIQADLNAVGFNAKINSVDSAVFYGTGNQGKQDIFLGEGSPDTFQPYGLYVTFFGCSNARKGRWGGWCNPGFDQAVTELTTDINETRAKKRISYIDGFLLKNGIFQTNYYPSLVTISSKHVKGLVPISVNEMACFKGVSIA
jgi:peptide/nickel transport system substrate-binding protein